MDIQVGKVRLAFKISWGQSWMCTQGPCGLSYGKKKSVFTSDFCHLFSGRRSRRAAVAMESDSLLFLPSAFLFHSSLFLNVWNPEGRGLLVVQKYMFFSLSSPSSTLHGWSVLSPLQHWVWQSLSLAFGMIVGQLYQRFKMSNALGIALWRLSFHSGKNVPGLARWSQEEDSRPVEHRDTQPDTPSQAHISQSPAICGCVWEFPLDWEIHPSEISWLPVDPHVWELK